MTVPTGGSTERLLIVNGDDFGRTPGINRGIRRAHEHGILTSASLMVRWPAAVQAAAYARERPALSVGLHLDLGEWVHRDGYWEPVYTVALVEDAEAVAAEVTAQLQTFRRLVGRDPTHVDSHQHVHLREPVRSVLLETVHPLGVPTRACTPMVDHCGDFHGQTGTGEPWPEGITVDALLRILATLPPGFTELGCHPGEDDDFDSPYRTERSSEVSVLCDPRVRAALDQHLVRLTTFHEVLAGTGSAAS
ncbi:carbohydrate deacetylase [Geodermatophilus sp. SYSU D00697]